MRYCLNNNLRVVPLMALLAASCAAPPAALERRVGVMGTLLRIEVEAADRATALDASEGAVRALEAAEDRLSTWRDDSPLARLNRGEAPMDPQLDRELHDALHWSHATNGAFQPRIAALVAAWDLRGAGRIPSQTEIDLARTTPGAWDEGGFGKGAGLRQALKALEAGGAQRAVLELGGQLAFFGPGPFRVEVADPRDRHRPVVAFEVTGGSVATSGNSEQRREVGGVSIGHLLDPRSGRPASDFGSLTVWCKDPLAADCLSTGLYVLGPTRALAWAAQNPGFEVLVIEEQPDGLQIRASAGLHPFLSPLVEGLNLSPKK